MKDREGGRLADTGAAAGLAGYVSVAEAARGLGVTERRVRQLIAEGKLQAVRVTRLVFLVVRASVEHYAGTRRRGGRPRTG